MLWEGGKAPAISIYSFLQLSGTEGPSQQAERESTGFWDAGLKAKSSHSNSPPCFYSKARRNPSTKEGVHAAWTTSGRAVPAC